MKVLAIPGKMPATESWLAAIIENSKLKSADTNLHRFSAWNSDTEFDVQNEIEQLPSGHYDILITKSIGTLIALKAKNITWNKLIFIGIALSLYSNTDKELLQKLSCPTLIIQENRDPFGSYDQIKQLIGNKSNITCYEVDGEHHQYKDTEKLTGIIDNWLN